MAQHDYNLANAAGSAFRADMNNALSAIATNNSGTTEPTTTFAYQWWVDTSGSPSILKIRNAANTAWITVGDLSATNLGMLTLSGGTMTGALLAAVGSLGAPGVSFSGDSDSGFYWVSANTWELVSGGTAYLRVSTSGITFLGTGATTLPSGTTAQRPGSPSNGMIRYNTDLNSVDVYVNGSWATVPTVSAYPFTVDDLDDVVEVIPLRSFDFSGVNPSTLLYPQFPWSAPVKLSDPSSLPAGNGRCVATTPNGEYVAVGHDTTPFVTIYQRKATEFVKLTNPATLPAAAVTGVAFSNNGEFLACSHATSPFVTIYQRAAGTNTWTKLTNPATLPTGQGNGVAWSSNGEFLAVAHVTTPFMTVYQRSGTTFTKLTNPSTLPASDGNACSWSPDGRFLAIGHNTSPFISIYERTAGGTLTKLTNPATLPAAAILGVAWSNDMQYLACVHGTSPFATVYSRSGTTFTKMVAGDTSQFADSADLPAGQGNACSFSLDGTLLAIAHTTTPFISIYLLTSGKWVKQTNPASLPASTGSGVFFKYDREMLYVAHTTTPFITIYQTASDMAAKNILITRKIFREGT